MRRLLVMLVLTLALAAPAARATGTPPPADPQALVTRVAAAQREAQRLPGITVVLAENGRVIARSDRGEANLERHTAVTPATRFEIGSVTKQFTAACILQLAERHKLTLDDRLARYVPAYTIAKDVTIRQLLTQVTGIPDYLNGPDTLEKAGHAIAFDALIALVRDKPPHFAPGTRWEYSNTNYVLLGRIVERAAGEPYERYVREHIFAPAGMKSSGFIGDPDPAHRNATGYVLDHGRPVPSPPLVESWAYAAGGIVSTASDLLAWDDALLAGKIVAPEDVVAMRTSATLPNGESTHYGYGWLVDTLGTHARVWHNGGTFGFSSSNVTFPADGETLVVLTNLGFAKPIDVASVIFRGRHADAVADVPVSGAGEEPAVTARLREWLRRFETGDIDRTQFTPEMDAAMTPDLIAGVKAQIGSLGDPRTLTFTAKRPTAEFTLYTYRASFADGTIMTIVMALDGAGKIAGYRLLPG